MAGKQEVEPRGVRERKAAKANEDLQETKIIRYKQKGNEFNSKDNAMNTDQSRNQNENLTVWLD